MPTFTANRRDLDQRVLSKTFVDEKGFTSSQFIRQRHHHGVVDASNAPLGPPSENTLRAPHIFAPSTTDVPPLPPLAKPWERSHPQQDKWESMGSTRNRNPLHVADIAGATSRGLDLSATERNIMSTHDIQGSFVGSRTRPAVRPEHTVSRSNVSDITGPRTYQKLGYEYAAQTPLSYTKPAKRTFDRERGPLDMTLRTQDIHQATPMDPWGKTRCHPRGPAFTRNPADVSDVPGARPKVAVTAYARHVAKMAEVDAKQASVLSGQAAAAKVALPRDTVGSLELAFKAADRDDSGLVTAGDAMKAFASSNAGLEPEQVQRVLKGYENNAGNIMYPGLERTLRRHAMDPTPISAPLAIPGLAAPEPTPALPSPPVPSISDVAPSTSTYAEQEPRAGGSHRYHAGDGSDAAGLDSRGRLGGQHGSRVWNPNVSATTSRPGHVTLANNPGNRTSTINYNGLPVSLVKGDPSAVLGAASMVVCTPDVSLDGGHSRARAVEASADTHEVFVTKHTTRPLVESTRRAPRREDALEDTTDLGRTSRVTGRPLTMVPAQPLVPEVGVKARRQRESLQEDIQRLRELDFDPRY